MRIPSEWSFKRKDVAEGFDIHVRGQLPWYELVSEAVAHIAKSYANEGGTIYDIGASTGNFNVLLDDIVRDRNINFIGIENSEEMIKKYKGEDDVVLYDAAEYDYEAFDVCICFLTLMFIPFSKRENLINKLISKINQGGCLIIVDKAEACGGYLSTVMYKMTLMEKMKVTSPEDIIKKELALTGIQRPLSVDMMPVNACEFFRFGDFAGWVIENNG